MSKSNTKFTSSKKVAGNAKKAENAAAKAAVASAAAEAAEADKWAQGTKKGNKKADDAAAKKAEADRKKAERDQLLAAEEASMPSKKAGNNKSAQKKSAKPAAAPSRGLDLGQLEGASSSGERRDVGSLNASGIDNALDALSLTTGKGGAADKVEKHPERRFKAAYAAFEARRLPEIEQENPGLRRNQRMELARKEFEKSPENPFNQVSASYDATREEIAQIKAGEKKKIEDRLAG